MDERTQLIPSPSDHTTTKLQIKEFQTKIGTLIWLMVSRRPDLSFVTIKLARHPKNPGKALLSESSDKRSPTASSESLFVRQDRPSVSPISAPEE
jgi:hypothetical protein